MRRTWSAVLGLALMIAGIGLLFLVRPQPASAQTLPPEVTYDVTCTTNPLNGAKFVNYAATIRNPNAAGTPAITYTLVRHWSDGRADNVATRTLNPGQQLPAGLLNGDGVANEWTHTLTVTVADAVVAGPFTAQNPCVDPPTTTTTTTTTTATTTTTTTAGSSTTTTTPPGSSTTTTTDDDPSTDPSDDPSTTDTDPFGGDPTTTTDAGFAPVAQDGGGGALAATGVAAVAILGTGLVLLANGVGLMRLVRRAGEHE